MTTDTVVIEKDKDGLARVTLNRPEVRNAFNEHMIRELSETFRTLGQDETVKAVILSGRGKSFSAGADLDWMKRAASYSHEQNKADADALAAMLKALYEMPKLTIACVQGAAMGGGLGLVACCDVVIAVRDTRFALSEVKLGLIPATISPYVMTAIGARQARRFFQTGEAFFGDKAKEIGLVHELAEDEQSLELVLEKILKEVRLAGPRAMAASKRLVLDFAGRPLDLEIIEETANRIAATRAGAEAREGITAFFEKRPAAWVKDNKEG
ncbi:enoyl-CoA hydratase-related protein [Luteithermobacter gelatinilyticus]|uniref:enoyl-CoA hydratase-related protein n=1 Tax=Luteithermobacter gelatinilyticus TaxID=2582913 RepID=UPI001105C567|nr:enoyl-CoA hydratase-related protein [Luteithermobacter gelatinilyticus]|tara:strand:- start:6642 stop:7448 length:807 start_codon:yes stop_codon:yes gene_type:complete